MSIFVSKKVEKAGYIVRERSKDDDRVVVITLTKEGRAFQKKAKDVPLQVGSCVALPMEKARELYGLLYELLGNKNQR